MDTIDTIYLTVFQTVLIFEEPKRKDDKNSASTNFINRICKYTCEDGSKYYLVNEISFHVQGDRFYTYIISEEEYDEIKFVNK